MTSGCGPIAQLAEHRADNAGVTGASPVRPTRTTDYTECNVIAMLTDYTDDDVNGEPVL